MRLIWVVLLDGFGVVVGIVIIGSFIAMIWSFITSLIIKRRWKNGKSKDLTGKHKPNNRGATTGNNKSQPSRIDEQRNLGEATRDKNNSSINGQEPSTHGAGLRRIKGLLDKRRQGN